MRFKKSSAHSRQLFQLIKNLPRLEIKERGMEMVHTLTMADRSNALQCILDRFSNHFKVFEEGERELIAKAYEEALALPSEEERDSILQRLVAAASRQGDLEAVFEMANKISDQESKAFALSNAIQGLLSVEKKELALHIFPLITHREAAKDALDYLIIDFIHREGYEETVEFIDSLPAQWQQIHAAKLLINTLTAIRDNEHKKLVKTKYAF